MKIKTTTCPACHQTVAVTRWRRRNVIDVHAFPTITEQYVMCPGAFTRPVAKVTLTTPATTEQEPRP